LIKSRFFYRPIHARASKFQSFLGPAEYYAGSVNNSTEICNISITVRTFRQHIRTRQSRPEATSASDSCNLHRWNLWPSTKTLSLRCRFRSIKHKASVLGLSDQWRRQDFVTGGEVRYGSIGGLQYKVPQSRLYCLVYQRGSLLEGLAMYLSCVTKKFHDNESAHILHNFWTSTHCVRLSLSSSRRAYAESDSGSTHAASIRIGPAVADTLNSKLY